MLINPSTPEQYLDQLSTDRKDALVGLRLVIKENLPPGFQEIMNHGMIGYVIPHSIYPNGYHCSPKDPLPFINIASQKNFIALYHMGIYADQEILNWFQIEYPKHCKIKLDMGKSCIRFKKIDHIPYELIAELCRKITVKGWIRLYEDNLIG